MKRKQRDVPLRFRRIAAEHLESIRGSEIGINTADLYLGDDVCEIYRPDIEGVAYYEFQVLKATRENVDNRYDLVQNVKKFNLFSETGHNPIYSTPNASRDFLNDELAFLVNNNIQGFIMVATNDHDFPISHWSFEKLPPSLILEQDAAREKKTLETIYKINSMAYLGEDANLDEVNHLGEMPSVLKGLPEDLIESDRGISSSITEIRDLQTRQLDDTHRIRAGRTIRRGPKPLDISFTTCVWKQVKEEFKNSFKPLLDDLRRSTSEVWKKQSMLEEMGEGIIAGDVFNLVSLEREFTFQLSGEAVDYVRVRVAKRPGGFSVIEIATRELPFDRESDLTVTLYYGKDCQEKVELFVVNRTTPTEFPRIDLSEEE